MSRIVNGAAQPAGADPVTRYRLPEFGDGPEPSHAAPPDGKAAGSSAHRNGNGGTGSGPDHDAADPREGLERELQELRRKAEADAERIRQKAQKTGYADGIARAEAEWGERLSRLGQLLAGAHVDVGRALRNAERDLVDLSVMVARKVVYRELATDREVVVQAIRQALEVIAEGLIVRVRVSEQDYAFLSEQWDTVLAAEMGLGAAELVYDRAVQPGGCVIETRAGTIDSQIDTKLAEIERAFLEQAEHHA